VGVLKEETADNSKLYCFGDSANILCFSVGTMTWTKVEVDRAANEGKPIFDTKLRYLSSCFVPDKKIIVSGGCSTQSGYAQSGTIEFQLRQMNKPLKKENMKLKRYGHVLRYLNGFVYAIGGFSHKDLPDEMPVTLASCERYNHHDNSWAFISTMNEPRAFPAAVCLEN